MRQTFRQILFSLFDMEPYQFEPERGSSSEIKKIQEMTSREDKRSTDSNANFVNKLVPVRPMQYSGEQENVHLLQGACELEEQNSK